MTTHDEQVPLDPEPFLPALRTALRPEMLMRAGDDLAAVIAAVKDARKTGKFTLVIDVKPDEHDPDVAIVTAETKTTIPRISVNGRLMWPMENGRLSTKDPRQLEIGGLQAVDTDTGEIHPQEGTA